MALTFPTSPADGDTHTVGSITWTYVAASDTWTGSVSSASTIPTGSLAGQTLIWNGSDWVATLDLIHDANMEVPSDF